MITQLNKVFMKYQSAIIIEDDILTNKFLNYMTDALFYFKNKKIGSISAYTPIINFRWKIW